MPVTRRDVLEELAAVSDASVREMTTVQRLASRLQTDTDTIVAHVCGLQDCELAHKFSENQIRITVTGEELLALNTDDTIIVDPSPEDV